jgi:hypothetical protein
MSILPPSVFGARLHASAHGYGLSRLLIEGSDFEDRMPKILKFC